MKKLIIFILAALILNLTPQMSQAKCRRLSENIIIRNNLFSINLPKEAKGFYIKKAEKDKIEIYDKASRRAGFGGFAFGIKAYLNPADHATLPGGTKLGELTDKKGNLYDIVLKYPTDVQHDYTKNSQAPKSYKMLYDLGKEIDIQGINGSVYHKKQGTNGEDLYQDILKKHVKAINESWDSIKLEQENMSYMYNILAHGKSTKEALNSVGYVFYDANSDGIDELFIGEIAEGNWKGVIYDIYTMVDRKPAHVVSGGSRNRYYACNNSFICNEYSSGAAESGVRVYILVENSTELFPQVSFKYDSYSNNKNPWFISYDSNTEDEKWDNIDEKTYKDRINTFEKYIRFDYIPLGK